MKLFHNSQSESFRNPLGAVEMGSSVKIRLEIEQACGEYRCELNYWTQSTGDVSLSMNADGASSATAVIFLEEPGLCWYHFSVKDQQGTHYYGNNRQLMGGEGSDYDPGNLSDGLLPSFQITVYERSEVPSWYKNSIIYQIFPDRFARGRDWQTCQENACLKARIEDARIVQEDWNTQPYYARDDKGNVVGWPFFGGNLRGIADKLFYLKSLGVGTIYLNPIFEAASNHKYDTADYMRIDPGFGTEDDFRNLAERAYKLGIRIILDGVFSHAGADSIYFNRYGNYSELGAYQSRDSRYYHWFQFEDYPDKYACWWGVKALPAFDKDNDEYRDFIYGREEGSVIAHWIEAGVAGWRLDVADELPDDFISGIRNRLKLTNPEGVLIGEVWEDASNKVSYGKRKEYFLGRELDAVMNYAGRNLLIDFMTGRCSAEDAVRGIKKLAENYPKENFFSSMNLIGSHDRIRIMTLMGDPPQSLDDEQKKAFRLSDDKLQLARRRLKVLSLLQFSLPGVPSIYYGDEAGLQGYEDPYNRSPYPWGYEDADILEHYRTLAKIRKQFSVLVHGEYRFKFSGEHVLICERYDDEGQTIICLVNRHLFADVNVELELPEDTDYVLELLTSMEIEPYGNGRSVLSISMAPVSSMLLLCRKKAPVKASLSRRAGILCHVSSLPGEGLRDRAESFIDFLSRSGQSLWQILPLNPPDEETRSPYSSPSLFAGSEEFIIDEEEDIDHAEYQKFCDREGYWLDDYALYSVIAREMGEKAWQRWPLPERSRENLEEWKEKKQQEIERIKIKQFIFDRQWCEIKKYANERGILIIGDLPIYARLDGVDTWAHREIFMLDEDGMALAQTGVPPDYYSDKGQNWQNPPYDWEKLKSTEYEWWKRRMCQAVRRYDFVRLDHFRAFSAFYAIPAGCRTEDGVWIPGPGEELFRSLTKQSGPLPIIAEDLGLLDPQVFNLLKLTGYPGMLVYQFSPEEIGKLPKNCMDKIAYTGTHDNQTLAGWCSAREDETPEEIISGLYEGNAPWVILPMQDAIGLDDSSRMNVPGVAHGNWDWKMKTRQLDKKLEERLRRMSALSGRR